MPLLVYTTPIQNYQFASLDFISNKPVKHLFFNYSFSNYVV